MSVASTLRATLVLMLAGGLSASLAQAAEIRLLSAGAVELGLTPALAVFERDSGHRVRVDYAAAPAFVTRFAAEPGCGAVIAPPAVLETLLRNGSVAAARVPVGKVGIGVAIRTGATAPDIATVETLKQELQNYTSYLAAAASAAGQEPARAAAATALLRFLESTQARLLFANAGIEATP
ncbi:MAG: substrate-binding domain-containing protein [Caldimonas sp.]